MITAIPFAQKSDLIPRENGKEGKPFWQQKVDLKNWPLPIDWKDFSDWLNMYCVSVTSNSRKKIIIPLNSCRNWNAARSNARTNWHQLEMNICDQWSQNSVSTPTRKIHDLQDAFQLSEMGKFFSLGLASHAHNFVHNFCYRHKASTVINVHLFCVAHYRDAVKLVKLRTRRVVAFASKFDFVCDCISCELNFPAFKETGK